MVGQVNDFPFTLTLYTIMLVSLILITKHVLMMVIMLESGPNYFHHQRLNTLMDIKNL